jgi:UDP-N-acetylmuramyl pentapeptide synthase
VIFVGDNVSWSQKTMPAYVSSEIVPDWQTALTVLNKHLSEQSVVLVKGSNGVGLKNLVQEVAE